MQESLVEEDVLAVPLERSPLDECCICERARLGTWRLDGLGEEGLPQLRAPRKRLQAAEGREEAGGAFPGSDAYDEVLRLLSCVAGARSDDSFGGRPCSDEHTIEVGGIASGPTRRELELAREELFTEREVALAANTLTRATGRRMKAAGSEDMSDTGTWPHTIFPGDLLQALPSVEFVDAGVDVYRAGDEGTVTRHFIDDSTNEECVEVTWARTGRKSGEARPRERFRFLRRQILTLGDLVEALPGRECVLGGVEHCRAGDLGTVSRFRRNTAGTAEELVEVTCHRTGKVGTVALATWMEAFKFVRRQVLEVGDSIAALPGVELEDGGDQLYAPGDEGVVTLFYREQGTGEDRMEVMWLRSGRKSDESARWMRWFRLLPRANASSTSTACTMPLGTPTRGSTTKLSL